MPRHISVVGLGYVGLPLAVAFGRRFRTTGFDIDSRRVSELKAGRDRNRDVDTRSLKSKLLTFSDTPDALRGVDCFIVSVPTPVDEAKQPDLQPLISASRTVGKAIAHDVEVAGRRPRTAWPPLVIFESTVYPGCTEEVCKPVLEEESGGRAGERFVLGYSPERINPGDAEHSLSRVVKVVSGQDSPTCERVARLYEHIVAAGIHRTADIRTAEAAKVIENVQRDVNIALMNELAVLFHRLGLNTREVLKASGTKWNFLPFTPGLVGGHCIPVDPYYLTYKAQEVGHHPEVILAGRRTNDGMGRYVAQETIRLLALAGRLGGAPRILVLGATFKENVPDLRNTRIVDVVNELGSYGFAVHVFDPIVEAEAVAAVGLPARDDPFARPGEGYDAVIVAVPHRELLARPARSYGRLFRDSHRDRVIVDLKGVLRRSSFGRGYVYWTL
jgi:UDP-N-acetyl-D-galactosamine dehydrogenase